MKKRLCIGKIVPIKAQEKKQTLSEVDIPLWMYQWQREKKMNKNYRRNSK